MSKMYIFVLFTLSFIKLTSSTLIYSPSNPSNFKNYAIISNVLSDTVYEEESTTPDCLFLEIFALKEAVTLCITPYDIQDNKLFRNTTVVLPGEKGRGFNGIQYKPLNNFSLVFVRGYVIEKPYTSSLSGFLYGSQFYGKVHIGRRMYFIEPLSKFKLLSRKYEDVPEKAVLYEGEDVELHFELNEILVSEEYEDMWHLNEKKPKIKEDEPSEEFIENWRRRCCSLLVLVDYLYFKELANEDVHYAIMSIILPLLYVNSIFMTTDFNEDGIPDDIGFYIKYISVLPDMEYHSKYFTQESVHGVEAGIFLEMFTKYDLSQDVCLGILFTAQPFKDNRISVSHIINHKKKWNKPFEGGICKKESLNTLILTHYIDYGDYVPLYVTEIALVHELGHNFGAYHDTSPPCTGYVMTPKVGFTNEEKTHFSFSQCSKSTMLQYMRERGHCLETWGDEPKCGNGIVEPGEECDCGLSYDCNDINFCCVAHDGKDTPCTIDRRSGFDCVPNQGFCCNKHCQFLDLSVYQIDCKNENRRCPCSEKDSFCTCGHSGICIGNYCHSRECVYSGMLECMCEPSKSAYCETCCLTPAGLCTPLSSINLVYVNESNTLLAKLRGAVFLPYETLGHKVWRENEICLSYGRTGYCQRGVCDLAAPTVILNSIEKMEEDYRETLMLKEMPMNESLIGNELNVQKMERDEGIGPTIAAVVTVPKYTRPPLHQRLFRESSSQRTRHKNALYYCLFYFIYVIFFDS